MNTLVKNILIGLGCGAIGLAGGYFIQYRKVNELRTMAEEAEDLANRAIEMTRKRDAEIRRLNSVIESNHETYKYDYEMIHDMQENTDAYISKKLMDRSAELFRLYRGYCRTVANDPSKADDELKRCENMMQMAMYDAHDPIEEDKEKEFDRLMGRHNSPDECLFCNSGLDPEEKMDIVRDIHSYVDKKLLQGGFTEVLEREYASEFDMSDGDVEHFKEFTIDISLREITDLYDGVTEELSASDVALCTLYYAWLLGAYSSTDIPPQYFYDPNKRRYVCFYFEEIEEEDFARLVNEVALCTIDDITDRFPCPVSNWKGAGTPGDELRRALINGYRAKN